MKKKLTPSEILFNIDFKDAKGEGQIRNIRKISSAYEKIERAIKIKDTGYNLYLIDSFSKERIDELKGFIQNIYKDFEAPRDICYVSIDDSKKPRTVFLSNGRGKELKQIVEDIKNSYYQVAFNFYNASSESEKDSIIDDIHNKRSNLVGELIEMAKVDGFDVKATSGGFAFIPLKEGEAMTEKEYDELSGNSKDSIIEKASVLKKKAEVVLEKLKNLELDSITKLKEIYKEFLDSELQQEKENCLLTFISDDDAYEYLEELFFNIEKDLVECYSINIEDDESVINEIIAKYEISVLVDNSNYSHPRVIYEEDPSMTNLIGNIEYESHNGGYISELSLITAGSLIKANEGCIIIRLSQLINNAYSYYSLKKALITGKVSIDSGKNYLDILSISGLKPDVVPVDVKVVLIGDYESYDILYDADEDFKNLFSLRVEMPKEFNRSEFCIGDIKKYVEKRAAKYNINNITDSAIKEIIKYMFRLAGNRNKITFEEREVDKVLVLVKNSYKGFNKITDKEVNNIIYEEELIENEIMDMYKDNRIILSVSGKRIGSINGLAVLNSGYYNFGKPMRVTCVACAGDGKIIDIQKENNLSGSIHRKSINILSGLLSNIVNQYERLPINFHLSFEQTYGSIDGDSASVAEMLCLLSALSKRGIRQNIAVTGSINQFGEVQPIGGVNEKIEGFFKACKLKNKVKDIGVLIPSLNKDDIVLKPEVEEAILKGDFNIYTMDSINDAIEVMILDENESVDEFFECINSEIKKYK
jgi:predicted ATP-dependent protease